MIYDTFIEPSGTNIEMMKHAYQCYYTTLSNGSLSPEAKKTIKVQDFDFLDLLGDSTKTTAEKTNERKERKQGNQKQEVKSIGDAIKAQVLGKKKNGK